MIQKARTTFIACGILIVLAACQPVTPPAPNPESAFVPLVGTQWRLTELLGEQLINDVAASAQFDADGALKGSAGCNDYTTLYETDGGELTIDPNIHAGLNVCDEAIMTVESAYLASLQEASSYEIEGEVMFIRDGGGNVMLVYSASAD